MTKDKKTTKVPEKCLKNLEKGKDTRFRGEYAVECAKKSAEKKRERKALKDELIALLSAGKTQEKISLALIKKALAGNVKAFEVIRDTIGEKPSTDLNLSNFDLSPIRIEVIE